MVETLVIGHHRNQYYTRNKGQGPARFRSFDSLPSKGFRDINCRSFHNRSGLFPAPLRTSPIFVPKNASSDSYTSKTPSLSGSPIYPEQSGKSSCTTNPIPIPSLMKSDPTNMGVFDDECSLSERWAGPAYSNSPPPSSLPIPKFSLPPRRTVSLDLPVSPVSDIAFHPIAKSAPPSPSKYHTSSSSRGTCVDVDSATMTLRRILNLDVADV